jgi:uncharacterized membrane protein
MTRHALTYAAALLAVCILDFLWLRVVARSLYEGGMAHVLAPQPNLGAAAAFYLLYPIGLVVFAATPAQGDVLKALGLGALFGLFAYGTYDLTNLAVIRDWPARLTFIDMAWGAAVSAAGALAAVAAQRALGDA